MVSLDISRKRTVVKFGVDKFIIITESKKSKCSLSGNKHAK